MATLSTHNLRKTFGNAEVIKGVNLDIKDKEFVVFVGPSGCGKSTILRMIAGLEEISDGDLMIDGKLVNNLAPFERGIAMVFQSYALYPHMSVFDNIAFPLNVEKQPKNVIKDKVQKVAKILELEKYLGHSPKELSGGQRQRVAIGRAIIREPKIFLFDEPLSNLDAALRGNMRVELSKLHKTLDATMIYVTHDQTEAMTMADKIVVLRDGLIEQVGSPMELYHHPQNTFVAGFIGTPNMNFITATVKTAMATAVTVTIDNMTDLTMPVDGSGLSTGDTVTIGIRPEHFMNSGGTYEVHLNVQILEELGGHAIAYGDIVGRDVAVMLEDSSQLSEGKTTTLSFIPSDCYLFDNNGQAIKRLKPRRDVYKHCPVQELNIKNTHHHRNTTP